MQKTQRLTDKQWTEHLNNKPKANCEYCDKGVSNPYAQFPEPYSYCKECELGKWWVITLSNMSFEIVSGTVDGT